MFETPDLLFGIDAHKVAKLSRRAPSLYRTVIIIKPNGGTRTLSIPRNDLKELQKQLLEKVFYKISLPKYLNGGIPGRSIFKNARNHVNKPWVVNFDIINFFDSIHLTHISKALSKYFPEDSCKILARLVTHNYCLPQGAPTSPFISNLTFLDADAAIFDFCQKNHLQYTRYFDDISISGKNANKFVPKITKIIQRFGFKINKGKTFIQSKHSPQYVTGLQVNKKVSLPIDKINEIQTKIAEMEVHGFGALFEQNTPIFKEIDSLRGRINFLKQVDSSLGLLLENNFNRILNNFSAI